MLMEFSPISDELISLFTNHAVLICMACFTLFMAWRGYKKGFMTMLLSFGSIVVTLLMDYLLLPFFMDIIHKNTVWDEALGAFSQSILMGEERLLSEYPLSSTSLLGEVTLNFIEELIIFVIIFIILQIIFRILMVLVRSVKRIRFIDWLDSVLGVFLGMAESVFLIWIFMIVISIFSGRAIPGAILGQIFESDFLSLLYVINPLITLLERLLL